MLSRLVEPELLDALPPTDPGAVRSRRDLRLINRWMGNARHLGDCLARFKTPPRRIVELGAGDGTLFLKLPGLSSTVLGKIEVCLVDMQPVVGKETIGQFQARGWSVTIAQARVENWLEQADPCDLMVANLFLHHFQENELRALLAAAGRLSRAFISCDPRRSMPALWCTRLLWLLACNQITRNDARISVRAGFHGGELSALWPRENGFTLHEYEAGFASHVFCATAPGLINLDA